MPIIISRSGNKTESHGLNAKQKLKFLQSIYSLNKFLNLAKSSAGITIKGTDGFTIAFLLPFRIVFELNMTLLKLISQLESLTVLIHLNSTVSFNSSNLI